MIFAQAKIFNISSESIQASSSSCNRYQYNYIPNRDLWIKSLYFNISNSSKKQCLIIDTRDVNNLGPTTFRTQADNNREKNSKQNYQILTKL